MFREAWEADVFIADLTGNNPNVYLELGVRWALRDSVTIVVSQDVKSVLFNVSASRVFPYEMDLDNIERARDQVVQAIIEGLAAKEYCDSPVRQNAEIASYRKKDIENLKENIRQLELEHVHTYINLAKNTKDSVIRLNALNQA